MSKLPEFSIIPAPVVKLTVTPDDLAWARKVERPGRRPRGYFDGLLPMVKVLREQGLNLGQVADKLIERGKMPGEDRRYFLLAMQQRLSRERGPRRVVEGGQWFWVGSIYYEAAHLLDAEALGEGMARVACGTVASGWTRDNASGRLRCKKCLGLGKRIVKLGGRVEE